MIKNIVLDFGNVLVACDTRRIVRTFFDTDEETDRFLRTVLTPQVVDALDIECTPYGEQIQALQKRYPEWEKQLALFYEHAHEFAYAEIPGMYDLLLRLKQQGYHLYGLSNWGSVVYKVMENYPIFQLLEGRVLSSEEHLLKPDPAIYRCLTERFGLLPEECLFVDDKPANIVGAKEAGMQAVLFENTSSLEALSHLG